MKYNIKIANSRVKLPRFASWHHHLLCFLGKSLNFFEPAWDPSSKNDDNNSTYSITLLWNLNEIMFAEHFAHFLAYSNCSVMLDGEKQTRRKNVSVLISV